MAKKGDLAREAVKNKIIEAFGPDYVAFLDKKIYVQARDGEGGEMLQFAIAMTMPKNPVSAESPSKDLSAGESATSVPTATPIELDPADKAKVEELKKKLGIVG